jgi:rhodanese-related sulfurtransferase
MPTTFLPEIDVLTLAEKLRSEESFILLDVRELWELQQARITDRRMEVTPMSRLASEGIAALSEAARAKDATVYVLCHHGNRSAEVTAWLAQQGWVNVYNVRGGIDQYAAQVDESVGSY